MRFALHFWREWISDNNWTLSTERLISNSEGWQPYESCPSYEATTFRLGTEVWTRVALPLSMQADCPAESGVLHYYISLLKE